MFLDHVVYIQKYSEYYSEKDVLGFITIFIEILQNEYSGVTLTEQEIHKYDNLIVV
jgi:hypothetical protein